MEHCENDLNRHTVAIEKSVASHPKGPRSSENAHDEMHTGLEQVVAYASRRASAVGEMPFMGGDKGGWMNTLSVGVSIWLDALVVSFG